MSDLFVEQEETAVRVSHTSLHFPPFREGSRHGVRQIVNTLSALENALYRLVIVPLVTFVPAPLAYRVACWQGNWRFHFDAERRERIIQNLADVLGERLSPADRTDIARDFFRRRSCESLDVKRLIGKGHALSRLVEIRGLEHLESALAAGKGAIVCSAHFGQFNGACSLIGAYGIPVTSVGNWPATDDPEMSWTRRIASKLLFEQFLTRHRRRPSIEPGKDGQLAAIQIMMVLRAREVVFVPIDAPIMDPKDRARTVQVDFLGQKAMLLPGCAMVAQRTGAPVLVAVMRRSADWRHQVLEITPPIPVNGDDTVEFFRRCVAAVEAPILQNLAHWDFWEFRQCLINLGLAPGVVKKSPVFWDNHS